MRPTGNCRPARAERDTGFFLSPFLSPMVPLAPLPDKPLAPLPDILLLLWRDRVQMQPAGFPKKWYSYGGWNSEAYGGCHGGFFEVAKGFRRIWEAGLPECLLLTITTCVAPKRTANSYTNATDVSAILRILLAFMLCSLYTCLRCSSSWMPLPFRPMGQQGLDTCPRTCPSARATLCTYYWWSARPQHLRRTGPLVMQPVSARCMRVLLHLRMGAHSLPVVQGCRTGAPRT